LGQALSSRAPQALQNLLPESLLAPHCGQSISCNVDSTLCCALPNLPSPQRWAHFGQNRESEGTIRPHWGQGAPSLKPQVTQNRKPISLNELQFEHFTCCCISTIVCMLVSAYSHNLYQSLNIIYHNTTRQ
jgi:hypothetical protein